MPVMPISSIKMTRLTCMGNFGAKGRREAAPQWKWILTPLFGQGVSASTEEKLCSWVSISGDSSPIKAIAEFH